MAQKSTLQVSVGLDIGSSRVRCVVGMQEEDAPAPSIIGVGVAPTTSVRKGTIVDIDDTVSAITAAVDEAERISGVTVNHASVGVNGSHILTVSSHGIIAIGSSSREITDADIERVEEASNVMQLPPNREIIQAFPRSYTLDGQERIKDPAGMSGVRLEVDTALITAGTPFMKNITRCVNQAGLAIDSYVTNPLAAATTAVTKRDQEVGAVVIDIGDSTTGLAVFEESELLHAAVIPVGAGHISNDLAIGLRVDIDTAGKIKLEHVSANPKTRTHKHGSNISVKDLKGEDMIISEFDINSIAQARLDEIFDLIDKELKKLKRDGMLPGGAILTGGGANMNGIADYAKKAMRLPARIGAPDGFSGIVDKITDPSFSVAIGLMINNLERSHQKEGPVDSILASTKSAITSLWQRFKK